MQKPEALPDNFLTRAPGFSIEMDVFAESPEFGLEKSYCCIIFYQ